MADTLAAGSGRAGDEASGEGHRAPHPRLRRRTQDDEGADRADDGDRFDDGDLDDGDQLDDGNDPAVDDEPDQPDDEPVEARPAVDRQRHSFVLASAIGLLAAWVVFSWMLTDGGTRILPDRELAGSFYDIQSRALLEGHLDVPKDSLSIEGFEVDGKTYQYFGPVPAVLRMPLLALTDAYDGRLSAIGMMLAWWLGAVFAAMLLWRVRRFVRGPPGFALPGNDTPFTRTEFLATVVAMAAYGAGTTLVVLAAQPIVYEEADCWAIGLAMASLWAVLGVLERLTYRRIALAGLFACLAFLTRATLGLVAVVTLAAVAVAVALEAWARRRHPGYEARRMFGRTHLGWGVLAALALATVAPVAAYASVNHAKFGTLFRIPIEDQVFSRLDPHRKEMLAANDNNYFRPVFIPTTALTYLRPDGIRLSKDFPFIYLPEQPPTPAGDVVFDRLYPTAGLLPTMPFWAGLAGWGLFTAARPRPRCRSSVKRLRTPLIGAAAGSAGVLTIAYISARYLGDFMPFLVLAGAVGLYDLIDRTDGRRPWVRRSLFSLLAVLAALSIMVNVAIAYTVRAVEGTPSQFHEYLSTRYDAGSRLGDPMSARVLRGDNLPRQGPADFLFIRGQCDGLYWSDGIPPEGFSINNWRPVERTERAGEHHVGIRFVPQPAGTKEPLLAIDDKAFPATLYVEWLSDRKIRFGRAWSGKDAFVSSELTIDPDREYDAVLVADGQTGEISVTVDGTLVFQIFAPGSTGQKIGVAGVQVGVPPPDTPASTTTTTPRASGGSTTTAPSSKLGRSGSSSATPTTSTTRRPTTNGPTTTAVRRPGAQRATSTTVTGRSPTTTAPRPSTTTRRSPATTAPSPPPPPAPPPNPAAEGLSKQFAGTVSPRPPDTSLCERLLKDVGG